MALLHPVNRAVLDRFGNMVGLQIFSAIQIGDGAAHFENAIHGNA